jgi:muconolactone delta-isomerase
MHSPLAKNFTELHVRQRIPSASLGKAVLVTGGAGEAAMAKRLASKGARVAVWRMHRLADRFAEQD